MPSVTSKPLTVAIVGATGVVGGTMIRMLLEREFPFGELRLLASARSAGTEVDVQGTRRPVEEATPDAFDGVDIALFSAGGDASRALAPEAAKRGATVIDNSSAWRMDPSVPLVVSQVNADDLSGTRASSPTRTARRCSSRRSSWPCATGSGLSASWSTRTSPSAAPAARPSRSSRRRSRRTSNREPLSASVYPHQIAFNALPQVDVFLDNGYTKEEWKVVTETRKILHRPDLRISSTAVRVPVFVAHSEAVHVETTDPITPERARTLFAAVPGVVVQDDPSTSTYPLATDAAGTDEIYVGRVRQDPSIDDGRGLAFWVVSDNLRKGAATNAVQIAEVLVERGWVRTAATRDAAGSPA